MLKNYLILTTVLTIALGLSACEIDTNCTTKASATDIGYVEYNYAIENNISTAAIENKSGNIIEPTPESASLVFANEEIPEDFGLTVPDSANRDAYPIVGLTWLLLYRQYNNPDTAQALENVVIWTLKNGDESARELGYIPLPEDIKHRVQQTIEQELGSTASNTGFISLIDLAK
jgi:phosphate transport system substrate-binding protein